MSPRSAWVVRAANSHSPPEARSACTVRAAARRARTAILRPDTSGTRSAPNQRAERVWPPRHAMSETDCIHTPRRNTGQHSLRLGSRPGRLPTQHRDPIRLPRTQRTAGGRRGAVDADPCRWQHQTDAARSPGVGPEDDIQWPGSIVSPRELTSPGTQHPAMHFGLPQQRIRAAMANPQGKAPPVRPVPPERAVRRGQITRHIHGCRRAHESGTGNLQWSALSPSIHTEFAPREVEAPQFGLASLLLAKAVCR
ncbi:hypothetical protein CLV67_121213 [Actinoplanes italicus]|uniref:Uncharacterized protein n=1 Tax=Actinoplanes italicus TaxID=113567 RepID=A0A2T0K062_9ACTN|nr:hypothetical protein CLV67_121213 [Actinoplanes italicus]